jgi:Terminase large subunit, T4likevirus-type, N-terminal
VLLNCYRQWGKSTTTAILALHTALYQAPALIVLISPSQPQSTELFKKIQGFWSQLDGAPKASQETLTRMQLSNGSRIISLPGSEKTTRGYSAAKLVCMDEASRCDDDLLTAVRPMLATTNGRFIALSTPAGKRGWWYEAWSRGEGWERIEVKARDCPRISKEFLTEELSALGPMQFAQEYECEFIDSETSAFNSELIEAALVNDFAPFLEVAYG